MRNSKKSSRMRPNGRHFFSWSSNGAVVAMLLASPVFSSFLESAEPALEKPHRREPTGRDWIDMDYGPYLTAALQVYKGNIVCKGLAIRLDHGEGGVSSGSEFALFDTDTLNFAAGWAGPDFINWKSIVYDGTHAVHASIRGRRVFTNPVGPGWGRPGDGAFQDPRLRGRDGLSYGPLPRDWAHWKGLYLYRDKVALSYTVGDVKVLELPGAEGFEGSRALTRTLCVGPRSTDMVLQVAHQRDARTELRELPGAEAPNGQIVVFVPQRGEKRQPEGEMEHLVLDGESSLEVDQSADFDFTDSDFSIYARIRTTEGGTILSKAARRGPWVPDGKSLFVRGGRLCYDIGWVGVVESDRSVDDGEWHEVAMTYDHEKALVRLYIDGEPDGQGRLKPRSRVKRHVVRLGYTSPDFPEGRSSLAGTMTDVRVYRRALDPSELRTLGREPPPDADLTARWVPRGFRDKTVKDISGNGHHARLTAIETEDGDRGADSWAGVGNLPGMNSIRVAAMVGGPPASSWVAGGETLRLRIPAGEEPLSFKLLFSLVAEAADIEPFANHVRESPPAVDLEPLTRGGPPRWPRRLTTRVATMGKTSGPYVIDNINAPMKNPHGSWMRLSGFDFFEDGRRAAVSTWMGDVWIVDGLGGDLDEFTWQRIATGLYQPLGLKIVEGEIYVIGRDQITRLHDLNGDGEADFYENFNNDHQATEHFHEFAMDLQTDAEGNFYYTKGGRHALDSVVPHHGTLLKVTKDGKKTEFIAYGFRAPNGLCVNPDGSFIISDQEGHWTPANRINWVKPGGFYGYMWAYHRGERPAGYDEPLCWIHPQYDSSPAEQLWVTSERWGPFRGLLLSLSYGTGHVYLVLHEEVEGRIQGGVTKMPISIFPTGIMRGRFNERDGQLYLCGLFGWSSQRTFPGGLYRVRYTGEPVHVPMELHATRSGVFIRFSGTLDRRRAGDPRRYAVERWNYRWAQQYGSKDYRLSDGREGRDKVAVKSVRVSGDSRAVFLEIPDMKPCMQMRIAYRLATDRRARLSQEIYHTIHALGDDEPYRKVFE